MKRSTIITITLISYFIALICMFFGVDQYVKTKDKRLKAEIYNKIDDIFANRSQYVDVAYSGYKVGYERVQIPSRPQSISIQDEESKKVLDDIDREIHDTWKENYGNLTSMYRTFYKRSDWAGPYDYEDGWNLVVLEHDYEGVYKTWLFPYAVGYIRQNDSWLNNYAPSVPSAVSDAFEFYTTNKKSNYYGSFEKGCFDRIWSQIHAAQNEYYYMAEDKHPRFTRMGSPLFEKYPSDDKPHSYQNGYMYNGYYKVFVASTQPQTYTIKKWNWNPDEKDRKTLWLYWSIGLTALMLIIVLPMAFIQRKHNKEKNECLYDKLKRLCNPANFISNRNYDKDKVDKANEIYKKLLDITPDNKEALDDIQIEAISNLGISLINEDRLKELKEKVNPKNFLKPYNAEKVALANKLYAVLSKEDLTYTEFAEVEEMSKTL